MTGSRFMRAGTAAVAGVFIATGAALAQSYPTKRVTLVVPFAPGGPTDVVSRAVMTEVEKKWGQPVVIENRPGAAGLLGAEYVSRQPADGYTLFFHGNTPLTAHFFMKSIPFNQADFRPVAAFGGSSYLVVAHPSLGVKNLKELIDLARTKPKQINYAMIPLTSYELDHYVFLRLAGVEMTPIPYQSAAPIIPAILRGDATVYFGIVSLVTPHVTAGKLVPLGYVGESRHPLHPGIPTAREQGYDFSTGYVLGVFVHSKTPEDVVQKLGRDLDEAIKLPAVVERLEKVGYQTYPAPLEWQKRIDRELKLYTEVVRALNYQPQ